MRASKKKRPTTKAVRRSDAGLWVAPDLGTMMRGAEGSRGVTGGVARFLALADKALGEPEPLPIRQEMAHELPPEAAPEQVDSGLAAAPVWQKPPKLTLPPPPKPPAVPKPPQLSVPKLPRRPAQPAPPKMELPRPPRGPALPKPPKLAFPKLRKPNR